MILNHSLCVFQSSFLILTACRPILVKILCLLSRTAFTELQSLNSRASSKSKSKVSEITKQKYSTSKNKKDIKNKITSSASKKISNFLKRREEE